jgi:hypothetical protein
MEIRSLTGYAGWDELLTRARREFSRACDNVAAAIAGTLGHPVAEPRHADPMNEPFPDDDDDAFYAGMAAMSDPMSGVMEVPSCGL